MVTMTNVIDLRHLVSTQTIAHMHPRDSGKACNRIWKSMTWHRDPARDVTPSLRDVARSWRLVLVIMRAHVGRRYCVMVDETGNTDGRCWSNPITRCPRLGQVPWQRLDMESNAFDGHYKQV